MSVRLQEELARVPAWPSSLGASLRMTPRDVATALLRLEDALTDRLDALSFDAGDYGTLAGLVGCLSELEAPSRVRLLNALVSSFARAAERLPADESAAAWAPRMEALCVLLHAAVSAAVRVRGDWTHLWGALARSCATLFGRCVLGRVYATSVEAEQLGALVVRTAHALVEDGEACKGAAGAGLRAAVLDALAAGATRAGLRATVHTQLVQDLHCREHLAEWVADVAARASDGGVPELADALVAAVAADEGAAKGAAAFVARLSRAAPRDALRNAALVAERLLDADAPAVRMAAVEFFGALAVHAHGAEGGRAQADAMLDVVVERLRDTSAFVRVRALHALSDVVCADALPVGRREALVSVVAGRVCDKASSVRRRAVALLGELLRTHPFCVDDGTRGALSLAFFDARTAELDAAISSLSSRNGLAASSGVECGTNGDAMDVDESCESPSAQTEAHSGGGLRTLLVQKRYYADAARFVRQLDAAVPGVLALLGSAVRAEVLEAVDFFTDAALYGLGSAAAGVRRMLHLVWEADAVEDGGRRSVREHVLGAARRLLLDADAGLAPRERAADAARRLLDAAADASAADLAALEAVVAGWAAHAWLPDAVVDVLFRVFCGRSEPLLSARDALQDRRGAAALLAMVGAAAPGAVRGRADVLVRHGLGASGLPDAWVAEGALAALRRVGGRLPGGCALFARVCDVAAACPGSGRWLRVLAAATETVYAVAADPSAVAAALVRAVSAGILEPGSQSGHALTKTVFLAGQLALLEAARLDAAEAACRAAAAREVSALDGVAQSAADERADAYRRARDAGLLHGAGALLAPLSRLVAAVCADNTRYADGALQAAAATALGRLMAVSAAFCDAHLPLFATALERSPAPAVRANLVVAFADVAAAHGRAVDASVAFLFRRLGDGDAAVRRTALLVLTHLALTGMVRVRGHVGAVARCVADADARLAGLARSFFRELAGRDAGAVCALVPDMLSSLAAGADGGPLSVPAFDAVARFVLGFVRRERDAEGLLEKLCARARQCATPRQARDLAFCLTLVPAAGERAARRLLEGVGHFGERAGDAAVAALLAEAVARARRADTGAGAGRARAALPPDVAAALDDLAARLQSHAATGRTGEASVMADDAEAKCEDATYEDAVALGVIESGIESGCESGDGAVPAGLVAVSRPEADASSSHRRGAAPRPRGARAGRPRARRPVADSDASDVDTATPGTRRATRANAKKAFLSRGSGEEDADVRVLPPPGEAYAVSSDDDAMRDVARSATDTPAKARAHTTALDVSSGPESPVKHHASAAQPNARAARPARRAARRPPAIRLADSDDNDSDAF